MKNEKNETAILNAILRLMTPSEIYSHFSKDSQLDVEIELLDKSEYKALEYLLDGK